MDGRYNPLAVDPVGRLNTIKVDTQARVLATLEGGEDRETLLSLREEVQELRSLLMQVVGLLATEARER